MVLKVQKDTGRILSGWDPCGPQSRICTRAVGTKETGCQELFPEKVVGVWRPDTHWSGAELGAGFKKRHIPSRSWCLLISNRN